MAVELLLDALTLEEKVSLLAGKDGWRLPGVERLGIPEVVMSDGPSGVRGEDFISGRSACFPCGSALGATWDPDLIVAVGDALGDQARRAGADILLGPTVNLHRHPLGGRNFECFSEDPELAGAIAGAYVQGVQGHGVACCIKHLVANDSEFERHSISSVVEEAVLRELYLAPFEEAVRAGVWAIMGAYNRVNGIHACEHPWLLTTVLRNEWGFDGVVVSDWFATHSTANAIIAGLDVEMPGPSRFRGEDLVVSARSGEVPMEAVDRAARRVLTLQARCAATRTPRAQSAGDAQDVYALIRSAGARGMTLLQNNGTLPLRTHELTRVALLGPQAHRGEFSGGGSAVVNPSYRACILPALRVALNETEVRFERGCVIPDWPTTLSAPELVQAFDGDAVTIEYVPRTAATSTPLLSQMATAMRGTWIDAVLPGHSNDEVLVRARARLCVDESGTFEISVAGNGVVRALIDGELLVEHEGPVGGDTAFDLIRYTRRHPVELVAGVERELSVEFEPSTDHGLIAFSVGLVPPDPPSLMERAVDAAREADVAILIVGSPAGWETEGRDRPSMALPGHQDELIERVAAVNPRTVVVVNSGSPCAMPWADSVAAILQMWFPGQALGDSLADVLCGEVNPSGRLPMTFPYDESDAPSSPFYPGTDGEVHYGEGLAMGYRRVAGEEQRPPRFAFGHGLSYSQYELGTAEVTVSERAGERAYEISVPVIHTAGPAGREVVQAYLASTEPGRPELALKGFASVTLSPGETQTAVITIPTRKLRVWAGAGWREPAEPLMVRVGTASDHLPVELVLSSAPTKSE